jgi:cytochrome c oxidase subunit 2
MNSEHPNRDIGAFNRLCAAAILVSVLTGCSGIQSALDPKGPKAEAIASLNWLLVIVVVVIYIIVISALFNLLRRASRRQVAFDHDSAADERERERGMTRWVAASVATVVVILIAFVFVDVSTARSISKVGGVQPLRIDIVGHQWWWGVKYPDPDPHNYAETANEIHVPVGRAVLIKMTSDDVIHSFWAPNLDGKKDLIPGHETITWFRADTAGVYRGQCAEFCGHQHAKMAFLIVAEPRAQFERWLELQRSAATKPADSLAQAGERVFLSSTCSSCHSVSGTAAGSKYGPDLTHLASRRTIAAGTLANNTANLAGWILDPQGIKPGTKMPSTQLDGQSLTALLAYLQSLK